MRFADVGRLRTLAFWFNLWYFITNMPKDFNPKIGEGEGREVEESILGKVARDYEREFSGETKERHEFYPEPLLFEIVKEFQPFEDPTWPKDADPKSKKYQFVRDLINKVSYDIDLGNRQLRYYTTVGSHLDWGDKPKWEGFDAFLEIDIGFGGSLKCKLDISINDRKITAQENVSDWGEKIVFHWPQEGISKEKQREIWDLKLNLLSFAIKNHLLKKAHEKGVIVITLTPYELEESLKIHNERKQSSIRKLKTAKVGSLT